MTTPDKHERRFPALAAVLCVVVLLLPVLYVLSAGPVAWLVHHGFIDGKVGVAFQAIYFPFVFACEHSKAFNAFAGWYLSWWV
jgi:hypothetical protein